MAQKIRNESEELFVWHCAPTLAGVKTANLFSVSNIEHSKLSEYIREWNKALALKGMRMIAISKSSAYTLIYIYRIERLKDDLLNPKSVRILQKGGYCCDNPQKCLTSLVMRLKTVDDFPHEIGLFLGYPPEDVEGFIKCKGKNFKCVGCWKVYGDVSSAQKLFRKYDRCKKDITQSGKEVSL